MQNSSAHPTLPTEITTRGTSFPLQPRSSSTWISSASRNRLPMQRSPSDGLAQRESVAPNAARFPPLPADRAARWREFGKWDVPYFPKLVGLELEEARTDYARMRLRWRPELDQPAGVVHGGAIATLID